MLFHIYVERWKIQNFIKIWGGRFQIKFFLDDLTRYDPKTSSYYISFYLLKHLVYTIYT